VSTLNKQILFGHAVDKQALAKLSDSTPAAKAVFEYLKGRQRDRKFINVTRLHRDMPKGAGITSKTVFDVFNGLEALGVGDLRYEETTVRFYWKQPITTITSIAESAPVSTEAATPANGKASATVEDAYKKLFERGPTKLEWEPGGDFDCIFPLRRDRAVLFRLPGDFTPEEAERLAAYIKSLAIPAKTQQEK
jgi:hypothetical protein